ncbi:WD_REPEATS_REGION domain-containing protein [Psidium guajava]|nr:WD_REPEATS_REGION domain-containing protein [Psidium guajava]
MADIVGVACPSQDTLYVLFVIAWGHGGAAITNSRFGSSLAKSGGTIPHLDTQGRCPSRALSVAMRSSRATPSSRLARSVDEPPCEPWTRQDLDGQRVE